MGGFFVPCAGPSGDPHGRKVISILWVSTLGEPNDRGTMTLFPIEIELIRGKDRVERLGTTKDDYGSIWIESDNIKITPMRIAIKFAIEGE